MTKMAIAVLVLGLAGCTTSEKPVTFNGVQLTKTAWMYGGQVNVMGRTWLISRKVDHVNSVRAIRDNNNLNPFGGPAVRRSVQAENAIEKATGCQIVPATFKEDISGEFFADVVCQYRP